MPRTRFSSCLQIKKKLMQQIWSGRYRPGQRLPMIAHIAKELGVSTSTVQKAVHELREEGIVDCRAGQGIFLRVPDPMRRGRKRIGLLTQGNPRYLEGFPARIFEALRAVLEPSGFQVELFRLTNDTLLDLVATVHEKKWAGFFLFEIENDVLIWELRQLLLPMVSIDYDAYHMAVSSVKFDNVFGAFQITRHLLEQGHRRIAFNRILLRQYTGPYGFLNRIDDERQTGYTLAMQAAGLPPRVLEMEDGELAARCALEEALGKPDAPSACICLSDFYARIAAQQVRLLGYEVPADLSIFGFGAQEAEFAPGKFVSTVRVDYAAMGTAAGELMLRRIGRPYAQGERRVIPVSLEPRDSSCPAERTLAASAAAQNVPEVKGDQP